jgi:hypothetical protein
MAGGDGFGEIGLADDAGARLSRERALDRQRNRARQQVRDRHLRAVQRTAQCLYAQYVAHPTSIDHRKQWEWERGQTFPMSDDCPY